MDGKSRGKRYSEAVKLEVVEAIEQGRMTPTQAQARYGIGGGGTIEGWLRRYGKAGGGGAGGVGGGRRAAQAHGERLARRNAELEQALVRASVKVAALEALLEEVQAHYGEDFKKNFATARSSGRGRD